VRVLSRFGTVGPSGIHDENLQETEISGVVNPAFYVVDDMYNDRSRLHLVEADAVDVTEMVANALAQALESNPGWGVHVAIGDAGLYVFANHIVPCGRRFWDCASVTDIAERCTRNVDFGSEPTGWPEGYAVWRVLVCGAWDLREMPPTPDRQWAFVFDYLSRTTPITQFSYRNRVRYDLHPATRFEFISRFLQEFTSGRETSTDGLETVSEDVGVVLRHLDESSTNELLSQLAAAQAIVTPEVSFFFWTRVVHGAGRTSASQGVATNLLDRFLVQMILAPNPDIILLSAILGLACLHSPRVPDQAARLSKRSWSGPVRAWLTTLAKGSRYPYPPQEFDFSNLH
jgi:hypothetical protein